MTSPGSRAAPSPYAARSGREPPAPPVGPGSGRGEPDCDALLRTGHDFPSGPGRLIREVADWCLQFHGGTGYLEETWTARMLRDTRLTAIGAGADEVMLQVLARLDGLPA